MLSQLSGSTATDHNVLGGYQPYSRANELVQNAFVDASEFAALRDDKQAAYDRKPEYHKWAAAVPGQIAVSKKNKTAASYAGFGGADGAVPVLVCAQGKEKAEEAEYFFAGVVRSPSIPSENQRADDEYFTLFIGNMCTVTNTSNKNFCNGDTVNWTFEFTQTAAERGLKAQAARFAAAPRRIQLAKSECGEYGKQSFATCKSVFVRPGEAMDILIHTCC